ncbi:MAG: HAD family phosphatase [Bernardetiaceae bacterium]|nr:HAD family phosphatase [Bernardetiaceae bacterium]
MKIDSYPNVIFDLGGVIINLDYERTVNAFSLLFENNFADFYTQRNQINIFDNFEKGRISADTFRKQLKTYFKKEVPDAAIDYAWNAMLLRVPEERITLLRKLGQKKRIFLLSNTNIIHKEAFDKIIKRNNGLDSLVELFEATYYSHLIGMRKPDAEIFEHVLNSHELKAEETLFIDDSIQHIETAERLGIAAYHLTKDKDITQLFEV